LDKKIAVLAGRILRVSAAITAPVYHPKVYLDNRKKLLKLKMQLDGYMQLRTAYKEWPVS